MKLNKKVTELLESDLELKLDEGELIMAQETLRKIKSAVDDYHTKLFEVNSMRREFYEHKLTETDLRHVLELLEKHRLNCKDFDDLVHKYKDFYEQGDDLRINTYRHSRSWGSKEFLHWSDLFEEDLLNGKKKHLWDRANNDLHEKFPLIGFRENYQKGMFLLKQYAHLSLVNNPDLQNQVLHS